MPEPAWVFKTPRCAFMHGKIPMQATMPYDERDEDSGQFTPTFSADEFVDALRELGGAAGTQEVADEVGCAYRTAHAKLSELEADGAITSRKVGNAKLWMLVDGE